MLGHNGVPPVSAVLHVPRCVLYRAKGGGPPLFARGGGRSHGPPNLKPCTFKTGGSTDEAADRVSDQGSSNDSESDLEPGAGDPESGYPHIQGISFHIHTTSCFISMRYPFNILTYPGISCFNIPTFGFLVRTISFLVST